MPPSLKVFHLESGRKLPALEGPETPVLAMRDGGSGRDARWRQQVTESRSNLSS